MNHITSLLVLHYFIGFVKCLKKCKWKRNDLPWLTNIHVQTSITVLIFTLQYIYIYLSSCCSVFLGFKSCMSIINRYTPVLHFSHNNCGPHKTPVASCSSMCFYGGHINCHEHRDTPWMSKLFLRNFASHARAVKQVYYFENTEENLLSFEGPHRVVADIKQFGVRAIKGGFRRRPELIKERLPEVVPQSISGCMKSYGLFDKCERIQQELTEKMLDLMKLGREGATGQMMLDIGCGHGWSLTIPALQGFCITGIDLDFQALSVIQHKIHCKYLPPGSVHVVRTDITNGLCFKESTFDWAISVSFLQWLCVGSQSSETLDRFFSSLRSVLKSDGKAGIQFYPRNAGDVYKVISQARKYFKGALVSDFPHLDRGRKLFLVLINDKWKI